jgi:hypothetical protein
MEKLPAGVFGRQAGDKFSNLAGQTMDEWGWALVLMWVSWPLWFSAKQLTHS